MGMNAAHSKKLRRLGVRFRWRPTRSPGVVLLDGGFGGPDAEPNQRWTWLAIRTVGSFRNGDVQWGAKVSVELL